MKPGWIIHLRRAWRFITEDVWDIELGSLSTLKGMGVRSARVLHLVVRGFREDECPLHASALTFSTLMSIVPVLALSLALVRGLGDAETAKTGIRDWIRSWLTGDVAVAETVADGAAAETEDNSRVVLADEADKLLSQAFEKVENVSFAALGGVGLALLVWMVISVMSRVESSFNRVWGVPSGRSLWRRFTDYLSVLIVLPFLATAASSFRIVDFAAQFVSEGNAARLQGILDFGLLRYLTVFVMTGLCFSFLMLFMPNTRVRLLPGLAGGFLAGALFLAWLRVCAALQVGVARSSAIYGGFAVVPILLAWVYVSWEIVLFGAEVAFAVQNCGTYRMEQRTDRASMEARVILALAVVVEAARTMFAPEERFDVSRCAAELRVPVRLLNDVVAQLVRAGLLAELSACPGCYVLLKAPSVLRVEEVLSAVVRSGAAPSELGLDGLDDRFARLVRNFLARPEADRSQTIDALVRQTAPAA